MGRRPKPDSPPAARGVTAATMPDSFAHIAAVIDGGGQIMLGTMKPIVGAAVAHDGKKTLVMLKRKHSEPVDQLLRRLDAAVATAKATGLRVDEINKPNSDVSYEL